MTVRILNKGSQTYYYSCMGPLHSVPWLLDNYYIALQFALLTMKFQQTDLHKDGLKVSAYRAFLGFFACDFLQYKG